MSTWRCPPTTADLHTSRDEPPAYSPLAFLCPPLALKTDWLSQVGLTAEGQRKARKKLVEGMRPRPRSFGVPTFVGVVGGQPFIVDAIGIVPGSREAFPLSPLKSWMEEDLRASSWRHDRRNAAEAATG